jgi:hypothetical protein
MVGIMDIERRETPQWADDRVAKLGGKNRLGMPNFRIVWGGSRLHLVGGMFKKVVMVDVDDAVPIIGEPKRQVPLVTEVAEMRSLHKYFPHRWWLEKWLPPEAYGSPDDWYQETWNEEAKLHSFGPYPSEGEYESVTYLGQCNHMKEGDLEWCGLCRLSFGEYVSLEDGIHVFEWHIWALEQSKGVTPGQQKAALFEREKNKQNRVNSRVEDIVRGAMRPAFAIQPNSQGANPTASRSTPEAKYNPYLYAERSRGLKQVN